MLMRVHMEQAQGSAAAPVVASLPPPSGVLHIWHIAAWAGLAKVQAGQSRGSPPVAAVDTREASWALIRVLCFLSTVSLALAAFFAVGMLTAAGPPAVALRTAPAAALGADAAACPRTTANRVAPPCTSCDVMVELRSRIVPRWTRSMYCSGCTVVPDTSANFAATSATVSALAKGTSKVP